MMEKDCRKGGASMKRIKSILLASLVAVSLTSCGGKEAAETSQSAVPVIKSEPIEEPMPDVPSGVNPLTGEPMDPEYENLRPVAVMLNNLKAAQPQLGTSLADMIYEVPAEGGITRMLALYQTLEGDPVETLGSIRSSRPYYLELALGHDALYVHAGGSPEAYADIPAWGVDNMDGVNGGSDAEIFWRDKQRRKTAGYEHSLLTSGENIQQYLDEGHFRTESRKSSSIQKFTDDGTPINGSPAEQVTVKFSQYKTGTFLYDAASKKYMIEQYGSAYLDGNTGEQVGVTNLLVLETDISVISGDTHGRLKVRTTGDGEGTFFCGGKSIPIFWSRPDRDSSLTYTTASGAPLVLGRGNTYICILSPKTSAVSVN